MTTASNRPLRILVALIVSACLPTVTVCAETSLSPREIYEKVSPSVCVVTAHDSSGSPIGQGSGFRVSTAGLVVTNIHVLAGSSRVRVTCQDGDFLTNDVEAYSVDDDLAILNVPTKAPAAERSADVDLPIGSEIFVIGSPLGLDGTITSGLASGIRELDGRELLQISAPISPGNSGGPVVDRTGKVVGVAVGSLEIGQNVNFAVPSSRLMKPLFQVALNGDPSLSGRVSLQRLNQLLGTERSQNPRRPLNSGESFEFRGVAFGGQCSIALSTEVARVGVANTWKNRRIPDPTNRTYNFADLSMHLQDLSRPIEEYETVTVFPGVVATDELLGVKVRAVYLCDESGRFVAGKYVLFMEDFSDNHDAPTGVRGHGAKLLEIVSEKYGAPTRLRLASTNARRDRYQLNEAPVWSLGKGREVRISLYAEGNARVEVQYLDVTLLAEITKKVGEDARTAL